jgi:hypothetical protein
MRSHHILFAAALLLGATAQAATPVPKSPAGTWDFVLSGSQGEGLAYLTFRDDFTFEGSELLTTKKLNTSIDPRTGGSNAERYPSTDSTNSVSSTNLFGFGRINGPWQFDTKGNVIGYFVERVAVANTTNIVLNSVGFTAKVVPGKRLTLVASTPNGKVTYRGVPLSGTLPDINGSWQALKKVNKRTTVEFYDVLTASEPFLFGVSGTGAGYTFEGVSMISSQKRIGFAMGILPDDGTNYVLRSVVGTYNPKKGKATTKGAEQGVGALTYDATLIPSPK